MASTAAADIRRLIYGGSGSSGSLSTGDLEWFRSNNVNLYIGAAAAAGAEAAKAYASPTYKTVGDLSIGQSGIYLRYRALEKQLRAQGVRRIAPYAGGISVAGKDSDYADSDMVTPVFRVGQFDNPGTDNSTGDD